MKEQLANKHVLEVLIVLRTLGIIPRVQKVFLKKIMTKLKQSPIYNVDI